VVQLSVIPLEDHDKYFPVHGVQTLLSVDASIAIVLEIVAVISGGTTVLTLVLRWQCYSLNHWHCDDRATVLTLALRWQCHGANIGIAMTGPRC